MEKLESPDFHKYDKLRLAMIFALRYENDSRIDSIKQKLKENLVPDKHVDLIDAILSYGGMRVRQGDLWSNKEIFSSMIKNAKNFLKVILKGKAEVDWKESKGSLNGKERAEFVHEAPALLDFPDRLSFQREALRERIPNHSSPPLFSKVSFFCLFPLETFYFLPPPIIYSNVSLHFYPLNHRIHCVSLLFPVFLLSVSLCFSLLFLPFSLTPLMTFLETQTH